MPRLVTSRAHHGAALLAAGLLLLIGAPLHAERPGRSGRAAPREVHGVPLPRGTRRTDDNAFTSSRSFRDTVDFYKKHLARSGARHQAIPVYRIRGITVARFLSERSESAWAAIHVFSQRGATQIYVVPRSP